MTSETVSGVVEARNARHSGGGEWHNLSKFKPLELPDADAHVRLEIDAKGFLTSIEVLAPVPNGSIWQRDERITRLAVLKAAATFAAARGDIKSADMLRIADSWVQSVQA